MPKALWFAELAILGLAILCVLRSRWTSTTLLTIVATALLLAIIGILAYECLNIEGPFGAFEAPYNTEVIARRAVEAAGGKLDVAKPDIVEVTFVGVQVDDRSLDEMIPYLRDFSEVRLYLNSTSVTCAGATKFERSMIECEVFGLSTECPGTEDATRP